MKKLMIALLMITGMAAAPKADARVRVNINVGIQPAWGPSGYNQADYYYMPDINCYYDVNRSQYIYPNGGGWGYGYQLPPRYRGFDLYRSYKVVMNQPNPYRYNRDHMMAYANYRNRYNQGMNRDNGYYRNYGRGGYNNNGGYNGNGGGYHNGGYNGNGGGNHNGGYNGNGGGDHNGGGNHNGGGYDNGGGHGHNGWR